MIEEGVGIGCLLSLVVWAVLTAIALHFVGVI